MNDVVLQGCTSTPLASYLKAVGVLRLLSRKDSTIRGYWDADRFVLRTTFQRDDVVKFFLEEYAPTPVLAPWNGGSGFYEKDNKKALETIRGSTDPRFHLYQQCLNIAEGAMQGMDRSASPKGQEKTNLQMLLRSQMPEEVLHWFDAVVLLTAGTAKYPPLLGTGGNDGHLDFSNNYMQRLLDVLVDNPYAPKSKTKQWLVMALFAEPAPGMKKSAIGQFSPGHVGGPNATTGFKSHSLMNPWDFVLMIEGAMAFAAAAVRRHANEPSGVLSYPFTVEAVGAGSGAVGPEDSKNARGELWMPLWSQPAIYAEVQALMAEGRVVLGRQPARDALDFVRAVHRLGAYRGVHTFQRFGLLKRSGDNCLAVPLGRVEVNEKPQEPLLDELDRELWLVEFRRFASKNNVPIRIQSLRKRLEDRLFEFSGKQLRPLEAQEMLILLREIQATLALSSKGRKDVPPVPKLSHRWVAAADDGTPAFRIAKALAGLRGLEGEPMPLRAHLYPVSPRSNEWLTSDAQQQGRWYCGQKKRLQDQLVDILQRRLRLTKDLNLSDKPLISSAGAGLDDVGAFLRSSHMDERIQALMGGLSLCDIPREESPSTDGGALPAAFVLLKFAVTPDRILRRLGWLHDHEHVALPTGMIEQLLGGNHGNRAVLTAWRRLHASGLTPVVPLRDLPLLAGIDPRRAAAALIIPLRYDALARCAWQTFQPREPHGPVS
ncbi:type I-G CRISPR-associated protein Cas8g1/Csx17 [Desulfosoma caldarium]|uniref:CRISPR-associated protein Csx17 n=1 Tax=Desulfosoma caldarium TaxID=610254 RepID=A0A3N1US42_9BACT|nr:type I-U CRISPR-associated protein Csx17 [Desulfosoma caldarium]ROQ89906.1 CRISPR-associated protein Csx17 [Desulfosoma caldarium]